MKRIFTVFFSVLLLSVCVMSAKDRNSSNAALYRTAGYKGSVAFTNQLVFIGLDVSQGYMFNSHHYLGGGLGFTVMPFDAAPAFGRVFADYKAYFMKRNSTPTAGVQAGFFMPLKDLAGNTFQRSCEIAPHVGWNWAFNEKVGLDLSIGAAGFLFDGGGSSIMAKAMPKISIGIEF